MFSNIRLFSFEGGKMVRVMAVLANGKTIDQSFSMPDEGQPLELGLEMDTEPRRILMVRVELVEDSE